MAYGPPVVLEPTPAVWKIIIQERHSCNDCDDLLSLLRLEPKSIASSSTSVERWRTPQAEDELAIQAWHLKSEPKWLRNEMVGLETAEP